MRKQHPRLRDFVGFQPADFIELAGSNWRSRKKLGGHLAKTLKTTLDRPFKSWGVKRRLELHIANEDHYSFRDPLSFPKLFVYSKGRLAFGFYIEAPLDGRPDTANYTYWRAFKNLLQSDNNLSNKLLLAMEKHDLRLADYYRRDGGVFGGTFGVRDGSIKFESMTGKNVDNMSQDEFVNRITQPNTAAWMDLHVFKEIHRKTALALKGEVATPILAVLNDLAPIYEFAISLNDLRR